MRKPREMVKIKLWLERMATRMEEERKERMQRATQLPVTFVVRRITRSLAVLNLRLIKKLEK